MKNRNNKTYTDQSAEHIVGYWIKGFRQRNVTEVKLAEGYQRANTIKHNGSRPLPDVDQVWGESGGPPNV